MHCDGEHRAVDAEGARAGPTTAGRRPARVVLQPTWLDMEPPRWDATDRRIVTVLVVLLVLTMRLAVPVGPRGTAVALPLTYVLVGLLLLRRRVVMEQQRAELYWIAATACVICTAAVALQYKGFSAPSLLLLLLIYLPWVLRATGIAGRKIVEHAGRVFGHVMLVLAAVGTAQFAAQLAGVWQYQDYLVHLLPESLFVSGYHLPIPFVYGSSLYKSNAFVLLEPSFLSQYCALAVIIGLMLGIRTWQLLLLLSGLMSAVSGTGLVLLAVGLVLILLRARDRIRRGHVLAVGAAVPLAFLTPVAALLLARSGELSQPGTSGNARFLQPYIQVAAGLAADPQRYAIGAGPGGSDRLLESNRFGVGGDVLYSTLPKLVFEYGLVAGGLFLLFILLSLFDGAPWPVVPATLAVMTVVLSGGLLQPQTASLAWLLTGFGATPHSVARAPVHRPRRRPPRRAEHRPRAPSSPATSSLGAAAPTHSDGPGGATSEAIREL